eukprot:3347031-Alexandrium_andersonii.AAC.1
MITALVHQDMGGVIGLNATGGEDVGGWGWPRNGCNAARQEATCKADRVRVQAAPAHCIFCAQN